MPSHSMKRKTSYSNPGNADPLLYPGGRDVLSKRLRLAKPAYDVTRGVSDELLLRIFSYADEQTLLNLAPVSRQFYRVSSDPQLWRKHYYRKFILPRANRIPGLQFSSKSYTRAPSTCEAHGQEQGQGQASASVGAESEPGSSIISRSSTSATRALPPTSSSFTDLDIESIRRPFNPVDPSGKTREAPDVDWKQQYRLRHNWARGLCEVRHVQVSPVNFSLTPIEERRTLVKVVDGLAVTVDMQAGLRAWDLRTQESIAQTTTETDDGICLVPTALALDGARLSADVLDIMLGFNDGTFGIWRLIISKGSLSVLYRQDKSYVGRLISVAYSYPYAVTAAELGFISLYTFEQLTTEPGTEQTATAAGAGTSSSSPVEEAAKHHGGREGDDVNEEAPSMFQVYSEVVKSGTLSHPHVLSSLKSDYSRQPLVLSVRKLKSSAVASIAYSFDTVGGWAIGVQNFDIRPSGSAQPDVITSRVAYTVPAETGYLVPPPPRPPRSPHSTKCSFCLDYPDLYLDDGEGGPAKLCYSHPYLLATMHDNTLVLFIVTATEKSFAISNPIKLFGHTSGIADADITPAGTAVSVSERGDEIRVWDLDRHYDGTSVEVRPRVNRGSDDAGDASSAEDAEHRRNWVGTDNQRVTVLRQTPDGRESLVTYDFT
ncbi:hypothetical protein M441DRAFT_301626 [Trichoderma asperellum CBS 433.97]|uniref:F-box domain-containing protein n=1 Tax=Trichoderma asperellum (strain ATCC 204424 / CBS 433.97 / NBRC 101777) TaxID=1042311 RepID=A0A2T3ZJD1_TRIA4|nr:hypothetical protein M441DRAFT_301626 [Trichoderma asperellum CBS 433.97]PTB44910.1 hypothetical protein M441DRAFT_301626 [Trichoderma asperellum CBS 433.97]